MRPKQVFGWGTANLVVLIAALFPVFWILMLSFKPADQITDGRLIPKSFSLENYEGIFDTIFVLTASTQNRSIETVSNLGYNSLLIQLNLGVGSAISVLIFLMVGLIAFVFIKLLGTSVQQGD